MQTEVMRYYGLARPPVDLGFFETEHHAQLTHQTVRKLVIRRVLAVCPAVVSIKAQQSAMLAPEKREQARGEPYGWNLTVGTGR